MDAVREKLKELMPQIRTFWSSENDWNQFIAAGEFDVGSYWSGSAERAMGMGLPVEFVVPEEGAIGWLDGLSIAAGSQNVEAALGLHRLDDRPGVLREAGTPRSAPPPRPMPRPPPPCPRTPSTARFWAIRRSSPGSSSCSPSATRTARSTSRSGRN
jgi:hypothetical protein